MKRSLWLMALLPMLLLAAPAPLQVQVDPPGELYAGEVIRLRFSVEGTEPPQLELPQISGAQWLRGAQSHQVRQNSINGRRSAQATCSVSLLLGKPGKVTIPPVTGKSGGKTFVSRPLQLTVGEAQKAPEELDFKLTAEPSQNFRVGQTVTLKMLLTVPENRNVRNVYLPQLELGSKAVLLKWPAGGEKADPRFRIQTGRRGRNVCVQLTARARLTGAGKFSPSARLMLEIAEKSRRNSTFDPFEDDDLFAGFFSSAQTTTRQLTLSSALPEQEIKPLPAPPAGTIDTGLIGQWRLHALLRPEKCRTGEVAELEISAEPLTPDTVAESVISPAPELPGFRVYPPESSRRGNTLLLRYVLIPLAPGEKKISLRLASYDPNAEKYQITEETLTLQVAPGAPQKTEKEKPAAHSVSEIASETADRKTLPQEELFVPRPDRGKWIALPLCREQSVPVTAWCGAGILLLISDLLWRRFRRRDRNGDAPAKEVRRRCRKMRRRIAAGEEPAVLFHECGFADVAEAMGLPAGSTAPEIASRLDDPELKAFFEHVSDAGFAPGMERQSSCPAPVRKKLLKFLAKLSLFFVLLFPFAAAAQKPETLNAKFAAGDYAGAQSDYHRLLRSGEGSPDLCFNLGCTAFFAGDLPQARLWLTRAHLLSPGDREFSAALRSVENSLQIPAADDGRTFGSWLAARRDDLRPDHYLLAASVAFFGLCLLYVLRGRISDLFRRSAGGIVLLFAVLCIIALLTQAAGPYSPDRLILTGKTVEVHSLPAVGSGKITSKFPGGLSAALIEERGDWMRIRIEDESGWIKADEAARVFPYGIW